MPVMTYILGIKYLVTVMNQILKSYPNQFRRQKQNQPQIISVTLIYVFKAK